MSLLQASPVFIFLTKNSPPVKSVPAEHNLPTPRQKQKHRKFNQNTYPETNVWPLEMDGWYTIFLLGRPIFRGKLLVSGRVTLDSWWVFK